MSWRRLSSSLAVASLAAACAASTSPGEDGAAFGGSAGTAGVGGAAAGGTGGGATGGTGAAVGSGGGAATGGAGGTIALDAGGCVEVSAVETVCDGRDDDCNGKVDDLDVAGDGFCDCVSLGIIGNPGANPSADFQAWLQGQGTTVERVHTTATEAFDAALLSRYDVVIVDRLTRAYTPTEAEALRVWVEAGGGFITMTGYANSADPDFLPNTLLSVVGHQYDPGLINGPVTEFVPHPLTAGLTSVTFLGGYHVGTVGTPPGTSTVVANLAGAPVGVAVELGRGRAFAWGDEWIEFDSEWRTIPEILRFWSNIVAWLGPRDSCQIERPE